MSDANESGSLHPPEDDARSCSRQNCPNKDQNVPVQTCARCKSVYYCGRKCQKADWDAHKHRCFPPDTLQCKVSDFNIKAIQSAIDNAGSGDAIVLDNGTYTGTQALRINKPITLLGCGKDSTKLSCGGIIVVGGNDSSDTQQSVTIADFEVTNSSQIENDKYKAVNVCGIRFTCPLETRSDAVSTGKQDGKILFLDCEISGGSDGISIFGDGVRLKRTVIQNAQHRGIFSRHNFVIEDVTVRHCGGYGIKGTAGWDEKGKNRIQPGPWGSLGPASNFWGAF